jgi:hypothetical protein
MLQEDRISILVPVSPIKSHPDTSIVDHTIATIRYHLPTAMMYLMMDGVRPEQEDYRERYTEFKRRLRNKSDENTHFLEFETHKHQVGMTRAALDIITTPLIFFVEQDMPLVIDEKIEWPEIMGCVMSGTANLVRFMHEANPLACHEHLYGKIFHFAGARFRETIQWSQRPHVASADFYRMILQNHFSPEAITMIEDRMHGAVQDREWAYSKLAVYLPNDTNCKRAYHTDGREGDRKYDDQYTF